jgi:hypothetical protein
MINQINEKFIDLFNTMGCKGEVCLDIPESPVIKKKIFVFLEFMFFFRKILKNMVLILKYNFVMEKNYMKW